MTIRGPLEATVDHAIVPESPGGGPRRRVIMRPDRASPRSSVEPLVRVAPSTPLVSLLDILTVLMESSR